MPTRELRGRWHGEYAYDASPNGSVPAPPVTFEVTITQSWLQSLLGSFRGTVTDSPPGLQQGAGVVRGFVRAGRIRFVKRMPVAGVVSDGRSIRLSEKLAELGQPGIPDRPGAPIYYKGLFEGLDNAAGTWVLHRRHQRVARGVWLETTKATGTWKIRRGD